MKSETQAKQASQTPSLGIINNLKIKKAAKSQSNEYGSLSKASFEGTGLSYRGTIIGSCDVTPFSGDQLLVCSEALSLFKLKLPSRKKQRVEILLQWGHVKVVDEVSMVEVQQHLLQTLDFVWKYPSSDKIFGIIIKGPSVISTEEGEMQQQTFYAYKMDRKVEVFLSHFKTLYQLWIDEEEQKWKAVHSTNVQVEEPEPVAKVNEKLQEIKSPSNLLDFHSDLASTNVNISRVPILDELLVAHSSQQPLSPVFNKSLTNPVVQNDPWTGTAVFMDFSDHSSKNENGYHKVIQNDPSLLPNFTLGSSNSASLEIPTTKQDVYPVMGTPMQHQHSSWNTSTSFQSPWCVAPSVTITENPRHSLSNPRPSSPPSDPLTAAFEEIRISSQFGVKNMNWSFTNPNPKSIQPDPSSSSTFSQKISHSIGGNANSNSQLFSELLQFNSQKFTRGNSEEFAKQFAEAEARRMNKGVRNPRPSLDELKGLPNSWKF